MEAKRVSREHLQRVLDDHQKWLTSDETAGAQADLSGQPLDGYDLSGAELSGAVLRGASLNNANLKGAQLTHADLSDASLRGADLRQTNLLLADLTDADLAGADLRETASESEKALGHLRRGPRFSGANLQDARLDGAFCARSDFRNANLAGATLTQATLEGAELSNVNLAGLDLASADLTSANLAGADLSDCNLKDAAMSRADLSKATLTGADISGANLQSADLADTQVNGITYDQRTQFRGIRAATCYGSARFRRFAEDQDYIEEFREAHPAFYAIWLVFTDCGRSMFRVVAWSLALSVLFGLIFYALGPQAFAVSHQETLGWSLFTTVYYSVVTFTTLGFGDITPKTPLSAGLVMIEVVIGYMMLGMLISILATKVARRS